MKETVITVNRTENINLVYSIMILGMLDLIEDKKISISDANMLLFLPLMLRDNNFSDNMKRAIGLCTELEAISNVIPNNYFETVNEIKELCKKENESYVRKDGITFQIN